jgi:hypothetical protein
VPVAAGPQLRREPVDLVVLLDQRVDVGVAVAATSSTSSVTPYVLTETPNRSCASTLSPSVTATSRMLSPNRARRSECSSVYPIAARAQAPIRRVTRGSETCPATVFRGTPSRAWT